MVTKPLPKLPKPQKPQKPCACGCGEMTRSRFAPGHDSRLRAFKIRVERGILDLKQVEEGWGEAVAKATARELGVAWPPKTAKTA